MMCALIFVEFFINPKPLLNADMLLPSMMPVPIECVPDLRSGLSGAGF